MNKTWRTIIVDDERLARTKLRSLLAVHPELKIVGEADDVKSALNLIAETRPEVIFLDIQMPGESGFELVNRMTEPIKIIFVTAFDEYALRAFEANALDYLLKPVNPQRLAQAIDKLEQTAPIEKTAKPLEYDDYLFLSVGNSSKFVRLNCIKRILAAGVYTELLTADGQKLLILKSLNDWEERLPDKFFARIHRSTIVNLEFVERVEKWFNYSYQVHLRDIAEPFTMSRRYAAKLKQKSN